MGSNKGGSVRPKITRHRILELHLHSQITRDDRFELPFIRVIRGGDGRVGSLDLAACDTSPTSAQAVGWRFPFALTQETEVHFTMATTLPNHR